MSSIYTTYDFPTRFLVNMARSNAKAVVNLGNKDSVHPSTSKANFLGVLEVIWETYGRKVPFMNATSALPTNYDFISPFARAQVYQQCMAKSLKKRDAEVANVSISC